VGGAAVVAALAAAAVVAGFAAAVVVAAGAALVVADEPHDAATAAIPTAKRARRVNRRVIWVLPFNYGKCDLLRGLLRTRGAAEARTDTDGEH
jgi:hypothetical protein